MEWKGECFRDVKCYEVVKTDYWLLVVAVYLN